MTGRGDTRILGLDVGSGRIGGALSDPLHLVASTHSVIQSGNTEDALAALEALVERKGVKTIVVGLPRNLKGKDTESTRRVRDFAQALRERLSGVQIKLWDERFSTVQAESVLIEASMRRKKRKLHVDKVAAALILQNYLDFLQRADTADRPPS